MFEPQIDDLDKICRVCLRRDQELCLIYEKCGETHVADILNECTNYKVIRFDELPQHICCECKQAAYEAYQFKRRCEKSYRQLAEILNISVPKNLKFESAERSTQTDDSTLYPCERCEKKFFTFDSLKTHREEEHKGSSITCRFCQRSFNRIGYLKTHMAVFHPDKGYQSHNQCHICDRQFTRREHMRRHLAVIHKVVEVVDEDWPTKEETNDDFESLDAFSETKEFKIEDDLKDENLEEIQSDFEDDLNRSENKDNNSNNDDDSNSDEDDDIPLSTFKATNRKPDNFAEVLLKEYQFKQDDLKTISVDEKCETPPNRNTVTNFSCTRCNKSFKREKLLNKHISSSHEAAKEMHCEQCQKTFTHISQYQRHQKTKHSAKMHKCTTCDKGFTTEVYLQRHLVTHERKRYVCKECSQSYLTREELNAHVKSEGHDKPLLCPECGLRCKTSNILMVHMRRHKGEKPYKCKFCSKGFPRTDDLRVHEKYHTGEKSHFCSVCGKGFQRKYNLTIHLRVHTGEKPYKCPHCPQCFAQGNDLKAHIRRHTGERFRCEHCGAAFLLAYQIRQHKLNEHGIKEEAPTQRVEKFTSIEAQEQRIKQNLRKELTTEMENTIGEVGNLELPNLTDALNESLPINTVEMSAFGEL